MLYSVTDIRKRKKDLWGRRRQSERGRGDKYRLEVKIDELSRSKDKSNVRQIDCQLAEASSSPLDWNAERLFPKKWKGEHFPLKLL